MSDDQPEGQATEANGSEPPEARSRPTRFSLIWLIPIIVLGIGAYLGWKTISSQGPEITIQLETAEGLTAGQTEVKHKAVALGTVESIQLNKDLQHVDVRVQMNARAAPLLTSHAKFWVVRPRLSGANISGLETLVSGAFIAIDPGHPGGTPETNFKGLGAPPGVRSDEPGSTFTLTANSIGSIGQGSPVFFRDVPVGEVLGYKMPPDGVGPLTVRIFIKQPYDRFLRKDSRFWNVSGISVALNGGDLRVQLESLQALISGGVAFGLPPRRHGHDSAPAPQGTSFRLYADEADADNASYRRRVSMVTYLHDSVQGLEVGSPVQMYGLQIGNVTSIDLMVDQHQGEAQVRVGMEVQPERVLQEEGKIEVPVAATTQMLVDHGMRAQVASANLLTGSSVISLVFVPHAPPYKNTMENDAIVIPSQSGGGLTSITSELSSISAKLEALPISQIGDNLNNLLAHADATIGGPELKQSIVELNGTLASVRQLATHANTDLSPVMKRLPAMSEQLQQALTHANAALASYGGNSNFHADLQQSLQQLNETLRSLRQLSDYLKHHPSSLIFGRSQP